MFLYVGKRSCLIGIPKCKINCKYFSSRYDCRQFGVSEPQFTVVDELGQDISHHESMWQLFEDFNNGLEELTKEDWISFRLAS